MEVILPCAGLSTRFPNLRPKYLLTDYSGQLMIENAVKNYLGKHRITIAILKEHDVMFNASKKLRDTFGFNINIIMLDQRTSGPADTVFQAIIRSNVNLQSQILIKDCDGFYDAEETEGNVIYVSKLSNNPDIRNAPAKSYTITNEQNIVAGVVEKQIVSNSFCVGGYQFAKAADYMNAFETLKGMVQSEVFVSNVIDYMICEGSVFLQSEVQNFIDGSVLTIYDHPWPGMTPDLLSILLVVATQAKGSVLIHQKMFESRLFFVDKLIDMGARIILCDPHRAAVIGLEREQALRGITMSSPDIRAGVALLIAALSAEGKSIIQNIEQIDRGYQNIDIRLQALGAQIKRIDF
jgi:hypothetical protein